MKFYGDKDEFVNKLNICFGENKQGKQIGNHYLFSTWE